MSVFVRYFVALFIVLHGLGHVQGIIAAIGVATVEGHYNRSWLVSPILGEWPSRIIGFLLYGSCMVLFIMGGLALADFIVPHSWWSILIIAGAVVSTISIIIFWNSLMLLFNRLAALSVNIVALVCLLTLDLPGDSLSGS